MHRLIVCLMLLVPVLMSVANPFTKLLQGGSNEINPTVLKLAKSAYDCAILSGNAQPGSTLTVIDYSLAMTQKRMWVLDMTNNQVLFNTYVAHGVASGGKKPSRFSNTPQSRKTSLGLYKTGNSYQGQYGYSLRLFGLDSGYNDNAYSRAIVMHGAPYVNGRLGYTWGCPAVPQKLAQPIINKIKGGSLVFAYYPNSTWLKKSKYLNCPRNVG